MHDLEELIETILRKVGLCGGPDSDGRDAFQLSCTYEFEPWGRASEDWDIVWTVKLPDIPFRYYDYVEKKWKRGMQKLGMAFRGTSALEACLKANQFLTECPEAVQMRREKQ